MGLLSSMGVSATGLHAERYRLDVIAHNLANSSTTRTDNGQPFRRKVVTFEENLEDGMGGVKVGSVEDDPTPGALVKDPTNPKADANRMVEGSNVNPVFEMVDLITATRAYEANITAFNAAKGMMVEALSIGSG
jgi:flagellar basal-body rod protein FlgC